MAKSNTQEAADTGITVRALSDIELNGVKIPCGRAALVDSKLAASLIESGSADGDSAAVAYALSENSDIIEAA